jgi:DNA-binding transcriptional ArsR family regulator
MVQYTTARLDASFAALSDATRRGVLEQLGRADASITDLAEKFHMTLTGMKKDVGVLALQLPFVCFEVGSLSCGLVSSTPE